VKKGFRFSAEQLRNRPPVPRSEPPSGDLDPRTVNRKSYWFKHLPDDVRFHLCYVKLDTGCWEWIASKKSHGYGQFRFRRRNDNAHRVAYILAVGPIPEDLQIDHLCRNRACVNPEHLEPVTAAVNTWRSAQAITHCPKGHPRTPENIIYKPGIGGPRQSCRECKAAHDSRRQARYTVAAVVESDRTQVLLTDDEIAQIRQMHNDGMIYRKIAAHFGISTKYAQAVGSGRRKRARSHTGPTRAALLLVGIRAGGVCETCGSAPDIHTHHRLPRRSGGTLRVCVNLPGNLLRLCYACHDRIESHRTEALKSGRLLHAGAEPDQIPVLLRYGFVFLQNDGKWLPATDVA
jgi:hypothetical protein